MLERTQYRRRNAGRSALLLCVAIASAGLPLCRAECEDDTDCGSEKAVINRDGSYVYTAENLVVARGYCRDARYALPRKVCALLSLLVLFESVEMALSLRQYHDALTGETQQMYLHSTIHGREL